MKREPKAPGRTPRGSGAEREDVEAFDVIPDVRDGLTRPERIVVHHLHSLQRERPGRYIATAELFGRVVEDLDITQERLQLILRRLDEQ